MIADDRDCTEIVQQLVAIRSAMQSASLSFMQNAVNECLLDMEAQDNPELQRENLTDLINLISKLSE
jgi:DNA-binding FrmR family transcriptional regulator